MDNGLSVHNYGMAISIFKNSKLKTTLKKINPNTLSKSEWIDKKNHCIMAAEISRPFLSNLYGESKNWEFI